MATYKEIIGTNIEVVSSDPSNPVTGQVWYNTTTDQLKARQQFVGNAWSSGGNLNTGRFRAKILPFLSFITPLSDITISFEMCLKLKFFWVDKYSAFAEIHKKHITDNEIS